MVGTTCHQRARPSRSSSSCTQPSPPTRAGLAAYMPRVHCENAQPLRVRTQPAKPKAPTGAVESLYGVPSVISKSPILREVAADLELRRAMEPGRAPGAKAEAVASMAARRATVVFICGHRRTRTHQITLPAPARSESPGTDAAARAALAPCARQEGRATIVPVHEAQHPHARIGATERRPAAQRAESAGHLGNRTPCAGPGDHPGHGLAPASGHRRPAPLPTSPSSQSRPHPPPAREHHRADASRRAIDLVSVRQLF
jgi:hypothetical protein